MAKTWIAFLRGINVGRNKRIAMSDLRRLIEAAGYRDVQTVLVSGNAIFTGVGTAATISTALSAAIKAALKLDVRVIVVSAPDLARVVLDNPFVAGGAPPKELLVTFLSAQPSAKKIAALDRSALGPDEFEVGKKVIYARLRNGVLGTSLPDWPKVLGVDATARNWNTVTRLNGIAGGAAK